MRWNFLHRLCVDQNFRTANSLWLVRRTKLVWRMVVGGLTSRYVLDCQPSVKIAGLGTKVGSLGTKLDLPLTPDSSIPSRCLDWSFLADFTWNCQIHLAAPLRAFRIPEAFSRARLLKEMLVWIRADLSSHQRRGCACGLLFLTVSPPSMR
jgi:hypothetical protein